MFILIFGGYYGELFWMSISTSCRFLPISITIIESQLGGVSKARCSMFVCPMFCVNLRLGPSISRDYFGHCPRAFLNLRGQVGERCRRNWLMDLFPLDQDNKLGNVL